VKGAGEGDIDVEVEYGGKITKIRLTRHARTGGEGKILSLKVLAQRGFESHIFKRIAFVSQKANKHMPKLYWVESCTNSR